MGVKLFGFWFFVFCFLFCFSGLSRHLVK
jgi:hypothetical protein